MKTIFTWVTNLLLAITLLFALVGCSNSGISIPNTEGQKTTTPSTCSEVDPTSPSDPFTEQETETDSIEMPDPTSPTTDTESLATIPSVETDPTATNAVVETNPPVTEPTITEPSHTHSYSVSKTVTPGCESQGYTVYKCSCGDSYNGNYTAALGHRYSVIGTTAAGCENGGYTTYKCVCGACYNSDFTQATGHRWGNWVTTKEPTTQAEGQKTRTCSGCGRTEIQSIAKKEVKPIDTASLEEYGRQYGAITFGYEAYVGIRAGYFPAYYCIIDSMEKGYSEVEVCVTDTTNALIAAGYQIYQEFEGHIGRIRLDVEVVHERDKVYYVTVYYG